MPQITYSHLRAPIAVGDGTYDCCPAIVFPEGIPDTDPTPIEDEGLSVFVWPLGTGTLIERLHPKMAEKIAYQIAPGRGFDLTPADVILSP